MATVLDQEQQSEVARVVVQSAGMGLGARLCVWVPIAEVPEGNWGAARNVIHVGQLRRAAANAGDHAAVTTGAA